MIIDTHVHFYDPSRPQGVPWPPPDNKRLYRTVLPGDYRALAEPEGVTGALVVEASSWLEDNRWVLDIAAEEPFIVGLVGHIGSDEVDFGAELTRLAANPLFRGIRRGWRYLEDIDKGSFVTDMEMLAARDLSLDVLLREPQHLDGVSQLAERIPELRIVINHIAAMPINGEAPNPAWVDRLQKTAAQPGLFMKVSALMEQSVVQPAPAEVDFYRPVLDTLWEAFGKDRVIYGSNWPVCERAGDFVQGLNIAKAYFGEKGEAAADKYFRRNAETVYRLSKRA